MARLRSQQELATSARSRRHALPVGLRPVLDLRVCPPGPHEARHYLGLLELLQELGSRLDEGQMALRDFHDWERRVADLLYPEEVDEFMWRQAEDEMDVSQIQEERYWNLRTILLRRKGLGG